MKKQLVYLAIPVLLSLQACNNNSASKNTAADSTTVDTATAAVTNNDTTANEEDTAASGKNATRIDASAVPGPVAATFKSKYPNVSDVKWVTGTNKKGKTFYKARWETNGKKMMAMFKDDGSFVKEKQL